ncbi:hypothetical protein PYCCODRAFT_1472634 [Trametes coccinea BRFM310]|uniref:Uncharacterized protein n=1 Tax=Trametes coccinea (strain BRFM310) TaxID=1353009 RepID=A0A1Y2I5M2_TRAC3|nr:hypothetical protein PYCCODRAFT_1472634 [Trametes coccinea BRFM310]
MSTAIYLTALIPLLCILGYSITQRYWHKSLIDTSAEADKQKRGFAYAATTALKPHRTTHLEFYVPLPQDYDKYLPTILRDFGGESGKGMDKTASPVDVPDIKPAVSRNLDIRRGPLRRPLVILPCPVSDHQHNPVLTSLSPSNSAPAARSAEIGQTSVSTGESVDLPCADAIQARPVSPDEEAGAAEDAPPIPNIDRDGTLDLILVRQINVRGEKGGHSGTLETPYFEIEGSQPIASPPPFTGEEDVQIGDIFYYRNTEDSRRSQMWIWQLDPTQGAYWKRVHVGYKREDGRRLTLTEKKRIPSWIGEKWYMRRGVQKRL